MDKLAMGVDIGGSHISCQLINLETNKPVENSKCRISVDSRDSKEAILNSWVKAIKSSINNYSIESIAGIGFAMPGPFDYKNGIALFKGVQKFDSLYGLNIKNELSAKLQFPGNFPIRFFNDAACFAIGEAWLGEVSKYKNNIALTLGTGFGTTFIKDGLPVAGVDGIPDDGFLYHIPFQNSIADDYFSTRWFLNEYQSQTGNQISGVKELVKLAQNNVVALELFRQFGTNLGSFLVPWVKRFNADSIVLGGNISKSLSLFCETMENQFQSNQIQVNVSLSSLDENAALIGSARLCDNHFFEKLV